MSFVSLLWVIMAQVRVLLYQYRARVFMCGKAVYPLGLSGGAAAAGVLHPSVRQGYLFPPRFFSGAGGAAKGAVRGYLKEERRGCGGVEKAEKGSKLRRTEEGGYGWPWHAMPSGPRRG